MDLDGHEGELADPFCLRPGEAEGLLAGHPWRRFAALGDSTVAPIGDAVAGYVPLHWVDRIATELRLVRPDLAYLNLGRRDLLAADVRATQLAAALTFAPDLALVACGANDALRPTYRPEAVDAELAAIITALRDSGADVITVGLFDTTFAPAVPPRLKPVLGPRMRTLSRRTGELAATLGTIHVNMTGHPAETQPDMFSDDRLHGSMRSHAIGAAEAVRRLGAHLRQRSPTGRG